MIKFKTKFMLLKKKNQVKLCALPCGMAGMAVITTCFGELADGNTGNGFKYCVTGGCRPLIWRKICAL